MASLRGLSSRVAGGREVSSSSPQARPEAKGVEPSQGVDTGRQCAGSRGVNVLLERAFEEDWTGPPAGSAFPFISFVCSILFGRIIAFLKRGLETVIFSYRVTRGVRETTATPALYLSHLGSGSLKGSRRSKESQPLPDLWSQGQHPVFLPALPGCSLISHRWPSVHMAPG